MTVWWGLWTCVIIVNDDENAGKRGALQKHDWPEIEIMALDDLWFQEYGVTCHSANQTIDLLSALSSFYQYLYGDINWPPRSSDLMPLGFFKACRERSISCGQSTNNSGQLVKSEILKNFLWIGLTGYATSKGAEVSRRKKSGFIIKEIVCNLW